LRILVVYPYITYPEVVLEFLEKLALYDNEIVAIFASNQSKAPHIYESPSGQVNLYRIPSIELRPMILKNIVQHYPYFLHLSDVIKNISPDLIVINSQLFLTSIQAIKEAIRNNKPSVLGIHGIYADRGFLPSLAQKMYLHAIGSWIFKNSTLIRCLTTNEAIELIKFGAPLDKIRIIPNGVDTDLFKPSKEREENSLIWVGRIVPEKGLVYLIKALAIIVREYSLKDIILKVVGDGPQLPFLLKTVRKLDLRKYVKFLGSQSRKEIASMLARSSLFVFPSLREGMPLAVLEAMSCGLPIIGSRIMSLKNLIIDGYNGLLVPPKSPISLANAIVMLMTDNLLRSRLSNNARDHVLKKYAYTQIIPRLLQVYREATL